MLTLFTLYTQYMKSLAAHSLLICIINAIMPDLHFRQAVLCATTYLT